MAVFYGLLSTRREFYHSFKKYNLTPFSNQPEFEPWMVFTKWPLSSAEQDGHRCLVIAPLVGTEFIPFMVGKPRALPEVSFSELQSETPGSRKGSQLSGGEVLLHHRPFAFSLSYFTSVGCSCLLPNV